MKNKCTVCDGDFDIEGEGGIAGFIGILPVSFCPTCNAGIFDMVEQYNAEMGKDDPDSS